MAALPRWAAAARSVEIDETFYGRLEGAPKHIKAGLHSSWRNTILALVERGGSVRTFHIDGTTMGTLLPIIRVNINRETAIHDRRMESVWAARHRVRQSRNGQPLSEGMGARRRLFYFPFPTLFYQFVQLISGLIASRNRSIRTWVCRYAFRERQFRLSKYNTNHSVGVDQIYGQRTRTRL